jgi:DNA-binding NarL/FixJ family response regulator
MRVLIADDHTLFRDGLRSLLEARIPLSCVDDVDDAVDGLLREAYADNS